jgi:hypothetical protein
MTKQQLIVSAFVVLIIGLALPLGHGLRSAIFLLLVALTVMTLLGGGMQYVLSLF